MSVEQRQLRDRLRARGRALGDDRDIRSGVQEITRLVEAAAYEHWHRLLFTRFLAGNDLLFTDSENGNVAVTLEECEELAPELGAKDGFELACRFSSETLPGVFRRDDPVLEISLAANHTIALRKLVESLPDEVFRALDALGWTYQFWQTRRKKEVNKSGSKIGAAELSPVTQLFTEDYRVEFLLHNTLGAWWAGRQEHGRPARDFPDEASARRAVSLPPKDGLPKPHSNDPTQWLFNGHPEGSDSPLHVAVARPLAYQWPRQTGSSFPDCPALTEPDGLEAFADDDGVVCFSALHRELPAAARLRKLLSAALGSYNERALIQATGSTKSNLEDWLRDDFFKQHVSLFHNRPFAWHLWDGLKDGFHVLVNYHRLDHATLNALTYTYLGDWIREQKAAAADDVPGAAERLHSAKHLQSRLAAILEGEAPLDLFVRWKPLSKQAIGWHPDLNDGIRLNIRPFLLAGDLGAKGSGLFRAKPGITLDPDKADRGTEPLRDKAEYPCFWCKENPGTDPVPGKEYSGRRWNGVHLSLAKKREAES